MPLQTDIVIRANCQIIFLQRLFAVSILITQIYEDFLNGILPTACMRFEMVMTATSPGP